MTTTEAPTPISDDPLFGRLISSRATTEAHEPAPTPRWQWTYPAPSPVKTRRLLRSDAEGHCPALAQAHVNGRQASLRKGTRDDLFGAVMSREALSSLVGGSGPGSDPVLIFFLPDEFEGEIEGMVVQEPDIFNYDDIDCVRCRTYYSWTTRPLGAERVQRALWLWDVPMEVLMVNYASRYDEVAVNPYGRVAPVVIVAGHAVVVGGFWVHDHLCCYDQATCMAASGGGHDGVHDRRSLRRAKTRTAAVGMRPWTHRFYKVDDGVLAYQPVVFDYRAIRTHHE